MMRILFLVFVAASVASASSSVNGVVSDENGHLIFDAEVLLLNPADQRVLYRTSVEQGAFRIEPVEPRSYFLSVNATSFREYADSVSVAPDQAVDLGRIAVRMDLGISHFWGGRWDIIARPKDSLPEPKTVDEHVRSVLGFPVLTVCEYLNLRSATPIWYPDAIVIGIVVQTPQGSWLRQSCRDSLRSGDYAWPNAIALDAKTGPKIIPGRKNWADFLPHLTRPSNEELDPRDRDGNWAAFFGRLETRDKLVAAPCGNGKLCGYGFGAISAPARLLYQNSYYFGGAK
jgi:hypothetical protein